MNEVAMSESTHNGDSCDYLRCDHHEFRDRPLVTWSDQLMWEFALASYTNRKPAWQNVFNRLAAMREYVRENSDEFQPGTAVLITKDIESMKRVALKCVGLDKIAKDAPPVFSFFSEAKALAGLGWDLLRRLFAR